MDDYNQMISQSEELAKAVRRLATLSEAMAHYAVRAATEAGECAGKDAESEAFLTAHSVTLHNASQWIAQALRGEIPTALTPAYARRYEK